MIPLTPTTAERLTKLEAESITYKMQLKAALMSMQKMAETIDSMATIIQSQKDRLDSVDKTYRDMLLKKAVQLCIDYAPDDQQPTFEDVWMVDSWKLGEDLLYRVEDVVLP